MDEMKSEYFSMKLSFFTTDETFPFYIHYGSHDSDLFIHSHENFLELVIVLNGDAIHLVNDEEFFISKGDVFIIGADTVHGYRDTHDFHICNIMFQFDYFFKDDCDIKKIPGFQGLFVIEPILTRNQTFQNMLKVDIYDYEIIQNMITSMIEEYRKHADGYKTLLTGNFYMLSVLLSRLYTNSEFHMNEKRKGHDIFGISKAIAYMESSYMDDITLKELAQIAGFSTRHFSRRFFEIKQVSPLQYIQLLRMQKATYYLNNTSFTIQTIANLCGFSDSNYFSRLFKEHFKISPSRYRRQK